MSRFRNRAERLAAFEQADLYPVISSEFTLERPVLDIFRAAARGGARLIQLREKNRPLGELYELALACRPIADEYGVLLIIDDHVDVALAAGADGVHLGQEDLPLAAARRIAPELLLGSSTHNREEALAARGLADYINVGPIFPTQTKSVSCGALGIAAIAEIAPLACCPFTVMGGIKACHIPELRAAGAKRIAMVTEVTRAPDVEARVRELRRLF
ncbi:MAG: thiamine phosphate synthase [Victivallaceae bacterium]